MESIQSGNRVQNAKSMLDSRRERRHTILGDCRHAILEEGQQLNETKDTQGSHVLAGLDRQEADEGNLRQSEQVIPA